MKSILIAAALACFSLAATADEAEVRKAAEARLGKVERVSKSPMPGIWEVAVDGQYFYMDDKGTYMVFGSLVDMKTGKNLTAERQFSSLPLELALKQVRGSGKNVMVTFEDPNCGYCKTLAKEILKLKDVTVYTFLYAVLGKDSVEKAKGIWCAPNRSKAWVDWMTADKAPPAMPAECDLAGLQATRDLGRRLRIDGTPHIMFSSGERYPGMMRANEIEKRLAGG